MNADEHNPRLLVIREIIRKGTNGLADVALIGERRFTFDAIRLLIGKQFSQFLVRHERIDFAESALEVKRRTPFYRYSFSLLSTAGRSVTPNGPWR